MSAIQRVEGSCLCGQVRFDVTLPSMFCAHCHCTMCQRSNAAAYVTWFAVGHENFAILEGAEALVRYASSEHGTRSFCGRCGSSMFCESREHPERIDITLASMLGPIDREPQAHAYFSDRAAWVRCDDLLPRLGGESGLEPLDAE